MENVHNRFLKQLLSSIVIVLQKYFRTKQAKKKYQIHRKNIIFLQKKVKLFLSKEIVLSKKKYKEFISTNKYYRIFVNLHEVCIDIQKNVRKMLARKKYNSMTYNNENEDDLISTEYSCSNYDSDSNDEEFEVFEEFTIDKRFYNIETKLKLFFKKYNPSKINHINVIVDYIKTGKASFDRLQSTLIKKYGKNLNDL